MNKDLKNKDIDKSFIYSQSEPNKNKQLDCKFIKLYEKAIFNNNIKAKYKLVHDNGGLENFNIMLLQTIECNKEDIAMYKYIQQETINKTIRSIKNVL
jgi:hypothetical protein